MSGYSPMLEQYFGMKARHPEAILLSRVGDFYEAYGEDAERIASELSIVLTSKEAGGGKRIAMAGVPHHALTTYLARLVANRRVVALAEQLEVPVPNRLVKRDVVRIITPGTLIEDQLLDAARNNYLAALSAVGDTIALAHADVSTGFCAATAFVGDSIEESIVAELGRIAPSEVVCDLPPEVRSNLDDAIAALGARVTAPPLASVEARPRSAIEGFSADESLALHRALDALAAFLRRTGVSEKDALKRPEFYRQRTFLTLDAQTRKNLELTRALGAQPKATLLATLDRCVTAMGSRLLERWLLAPLVDASAIATRADGVQTFAESQGTRDDCRQRLRAVCDIERIAQKVRFRRVTARDFVALRRALEALEPLRAAIPGSLGRCAQRIGDFRSLAGELARSLADDPPSQIGEGGVFRVEADPELARCVALRTGARAKLAEFEANERRETGIKNLKIKYAPAFGYALEVPRASANDVPARYVRKQTLANSERFTTPELRELEVEIAEAESRQKQLEQELFERLVDHAAERIEDLLIAADALAEIDTLASLALVAAERGYVRPQIVEESCIEVHDGRHPVIEALGGGSFVPNDLRLAQDSPRFIVLTGPNMGGKSTYLRQTALLVILAQIGSFVPAKSARIGLVDRIFTRIGAGDDLASGQSTFYLEMSEAATILRRSTARSLLLIDEIGRGTGTVDGLAIAQAISEFLLGLGAQTPLVLFATHFHELVTLSERWKGIANFHITAVRSSSGAGGPVFSHRVLPGSSSQSFGIEVARMAGLPEGVVARAREIAEVLSGRPALSDQVPLRTKLARPPGPEQPPLFTA